MKYIEIDSLIAEVQRRKEICQQVNDEQSDDYYLGKASAYAEMAAFLVSVGQRNPGNEICIHL